MGELVVTAGKPFAQTIRVPDAKNIWPTVDLLEVRAQLRTGPRAIDPLIANLHLFMTWDYDGDDLVITWVMSGLETRTLFNNVMWSVNKKALFNLVVSDLGTVDAHALVSPAIALRMVDSTTLPAGQL